MTDKLKEQAESFIDIFPRLMRSLYTLSADDPAMDLPVAQLRVCSILKDGPLSMSAISRELGITHSAMTQIADRLERHSMVERVCETEDRRVKCLQLTGHGQEVMQTRRKKRLESVLKVMERLSLEERESLITALNTFYQASRSHVNEQLDNLVIVPQPELI